MIGVHNIDERSDDSDTYASMVPISEPILIDTSQSKTQSQSARRRFTSNHLSETTHDICTLLREQLRTNHDTKWPTVAKLIPNPNTKRRIAEVSTKRQR